MANNKKDGSSADLAKQAAQASAKKQSQNNQNKSSKKKGGIIAYLRGVRQEFRKVVWPTREELTQDSLPHSRAYSASLYPREITDGRHG